MKRFYNFALVAVLLGVAGVAAADGEWIREKAVWIKGQLYTGSSKITLTNSTGNLSTTTGTFSGNVGVAGALTVTGALTNSGGPPIFATAETGLTAHSGGTQAAALALSATKFIHQVTTVAAGADSVALPAPALGTCHLVVNEAASNSMQVFAVTPATVNGKATATGIAVAAGKGELCCAASSTDYACGGA